MNPSEKTLTTFETRVRQLILRIQELKKENDVLVAMVSENEQVIADLNAKLSQANELCISLAADVVDRRIHGYRLHVWKILVYLQRYLLQLACAERKRIAVLKEHPPRMRRKGPGFSKILLDLLHGLDAERCIPVHGAERAPVMRASCRHLQEQ